jgi:hypothetical protein
MTNQNIRVSSHRCVDRKPGHLIAQQPVLCIRWNTANQIAGIDVLDTDRNFLLLEVALNP